MKAQHDNTYAVKHLLEDLPEAPCDDCDHWYRCKHERIMCMDFYAYVNSGVIYSKNDRYPTKRIFDKLYKDKDDGQSKPSKSNKIKQSPKGRVLRRWGFFYNAARGR